MGAFQALGEDASDSPGGAINGAEHILIAFFHSDGAKGHHLGLNTAGHFRDHAVLAGEFGGDLSNPAAEAA
jgi:hypothetical protein